ncbi:MAG: 50S ribosomal protein L5 [Patescibacteria group bacterium]
MSLTKDKITKGEEALKKTLGVKSVMALPRIIKVVVSVGVGKMREKKQLELIADRLAKITGQKAVPRGAKKSVASFKVRQGETVGMMITLRGARMWGFLDKLFNVAVPRMRDFRGFSESSVSDSGTLSLGFREHTIFPETADEEAKDIFGFGVSIVTTAKTKTEALALFHTISLPFKKN